MKTLLYESFKEEEGEMEKTVKVTDYFIVSLLYLALKSQEDEQAEKMPHLVPAISQFFRVP